MSRQLLSIYGKREQINRNDLRTIAKQINVKKPDQLIDKVKENEYNYENYAKQISVGRMCYKEH
ncbi:MAG: hypothetical protein H7202_06835 [Pedobacter sp.]|nr:hypothetical protein [Pedobacter sp.]